MHLERRLLLLIGLILALALTALSFVAGSFASGEPPGQAWGGLVDSLGWNLGLLVLSWLAMAWAVRRYVSHPIAVLRQGVEGLARGARVSPHAALPPEGAAPGLGRPGAGGAHRAAVLPGILGAIGQAIEEMAASLEQERERLRESEEHFRLLSENAHDCVFWIDAQSRFSYLSPSCREIFGYTPGEFMADPGLMASVVHADDRPAYLAHIGCPKDHDGAELEFRILHRDGTERWIAHHCRPVFGEAGEFLGRRGSNRDVSARKRAEIQLRKLFLAVEQGPAGVVITDLDARVEYVNDAFVRISGYRREDVIGRNPRMLRSEHNPSALYEDLWATLGRGETWEGEFINLRADGAIYTELARIAPVRQADGRITHFVGIKEDITERKRNAEELDALRHRLEELVAERTRRIEQLNVELAQRAHEAEIANRAKSAFLANMSHEIRTPMNAIVGFSQILQRSELSGAQRDKLERICGAADHLLAILNDILEISKIEAGKLTLDNTDFELDTVVRNVRAMVVERARAKGLDFAVDTDGIPGTLHGDATRLAQILLNFLSNAVKFTDSGSVTLRARLVEQGAQDLLIRFEVRDTGIGIDASRLERIFGAFEQADGSTTRRYGGTGLGLAINRHLAGLMGGDTGVDSAPGAGSTFWATVRFGRCSSAPQQPECAVGGDDSPAAADPEQILLDHHRGTRLLLAEDEPVNQEVALELLRGAGLEVDLARNGVEAVDLATRNDYAVILMDMHMPGMDGIEATRAIRRLDGRAGTPIIAVTANAFGEDRQRCLRAGMNDHLAKPFAPDALFATVVRWLYRR